LVIDCDLFELLLGGFGQFIMVARERNLMIYSCSMPLGRRIVEVVMLASLLIVDEADVDMILDRLADAVGDLRL